MKKNFAATVMAMTLVTAGSAYAADGTIEFTGKITETACTIATPKVVVNFGTIAASAFKNVGDVAAAQGFQIEVNNCPTSAAKVRFDAEAEASDSNLFALGADSTVTGVGISLFDRDAEQITPGYNSGVYNLQPSSNQVLPFTAKLESTAASVKAGDIKASADFTIIYE